MNSWSKEESLASFYSQYLEVCKQTNEDIREFNDRLNALISKLPLDFLPKDSILQHYLNSLEGTLQFTLQDRSPTSLEMAQEVACEIEENLRFNDSIHRINLLNDNDISEPNDERMVELKHNLPEILEVEYSAYPRKWSTGFSNMKDASLLSQQNEPPEDLKPTQDTFRNLEAYDIGYSLSQIDEEDNFEEEFPVVHQVGNM
jgi:hypothetical protein